MKQMMKACALSVLIATTPSFAAPEPQPIQIVSPYPQLNKINFMVTAEQWVTTDTAKAMVRVDANLDQAGLESLQAEVMANLNKIAKNAEWRITEYQRQQDQSDLEKVTIQAEARLPEKELTDLRSKLKSLSKPGVKYSVQDIQYEPGLADVETVREQVRQQLYQKIQQEIKLVNQTYAGQNYTVHKILFTQDGVEPVMMQKRTMLMAAAPNASSDSAAAGGMQTSKKVVMAASVVIAAPVAADKSQ